MGQTPPQAREGVYMSYEGFAKLQSKLAGKPGVTNPGALAASIGRHKYGSGTFNRAAAKGQTLRKVAAQRAAKR